MNTKSIVSYIFELGQLRHVRHTGYYTLGIHDPKNVAEHSLRVAQIGYFLAVMEKYPNPFEVVTMLVFHETGECRIGDLHRIANRYLKDIKSAEELAAYDQYKPFGPEGEKLLDLIHQCETRSTQAGTIAKDADRLEIAFTAKELLEKGYEYAKSWIDHIKGDLQTTSAKQLVAELVKSNSNDWWQGLKKYPE